MTKPMPHNNADDREQFVDKFLDRLISRETHKGSYQRVKFVAKQRLLDRFAQVEREARIDELEELHRSQGEGLPKRDYDNETDELIDDRLAAASNFGL